MNIVAISGKRRSGKSLLGSILQNEYQFVPVSLAAPLKSMCREHFGLSEAQTDGELKEVLDPRYELTPRQLMIKFGAFYRSIDKDYWVKKLFSSLSDENKSYVVTDMRFKNEYNFFRERGAMLVRLDRAEAYTGININDPSETELDDIASWDVYIPPHLNQTHDDMLHTADFIGTLSRVA
jgi:phosphomevalonate kinase